MVTAMVKYIYIGAYSFNNRSETGVIDSDNVTLHK